ncbi:MAG: histidine phosphatase family protein [Ilumatobacteraceae bacterium]
MELLFIRHALPIRREVTEGAADPPLSDIGHQQAQLLTDYLASEHIDAIYASPLKRAVETAQPLSERHGKPSVLDAGLAEFDQHSSEYIPVEEMKANNDPRLSDFFQGESEDYDDRIEFRDRVLGSVSRIISHHGGERVAIVCHGGVINCYAGDVLGIDVDGPGFFYPNYTSITRIAASRSGVRSIVTINETSHLRNTGLPMGLFQHG